MPFELQKGSRASHSGQGSTGGGLTKEELQLLISALNTMRVKLGDAPIYLALLRKLNRMVEE